MAGVSTSLLFGSFSSFCELRRFLTILGGRLGTFGREATLGLSLRGFRGAGLLTSFASFLFVASGDNEK